MLILTSTTLCLSLDRSLTSRVRPLGHQQTASYRTIQKYSTNQQTAPESLGTSQEWDTRLSQGTMHSGKYTPIHIVYYIRFYIRNYALQLTIRNYALQLTSSGNNCCQMVRLGNNSATAPLNHTYKIKPKEQQEKIQYKPIFHKT